ncbi:MAG: hypothetical protein IJX49_05465 [Clostridia bacterium]|nr:hypothetical protein [Clostridia bacterium]
MNEEIEYAEMLEIPVSTVNVVRKKRRKKQSSPVLPTAQEELPLKDSVIAQVNDRIGDPTTEPTFPEAELSLPEEEGRLDFDPIPDRIDTVRLYASEGKRSFWKKNGLQAQDYAFTPENQNEGGRYELNSKKHPSKAVRIALGAEFAAACVLCGAFFFTNVFMPSSAINTFFRALGNPSTETSATDTRAYSDFTLSPVVSELSDTEITLSETGVLSFTDECCVYPTADGTVSEVTKTEEGLYTLKISHSDTFTGVIQGLDYVYYAVGDEVKANVPVGFSKGDSEVQVTMYSQGELLNCFQLTEENCLAWVSEE